MSPNHQEDVCGYELASARHDEDLEEQYDLDTWYEEDEKHHCNRQLWEGRDTNRCIWHADIEDKPVDELERARLDEPERLDGAILRRTEIRNSVSFTECRLKLADLSHVDLREGDLDDTIFNRANLSDAQLGQAEIKEADLQFADLSGADFQHADLTGADFTGADLSNSILENADLADAILEDCDMTTARLSNSTLDGANLQRADLTNAALYGADLNRVKLTGTKLENIHIGEDTGLGPFSGYEIESDQIAVGRSGLAGKISPRFRCVGRPFSSPFLLEQAEVQYRRMQRLRRENDLKMDLTIEIREKHARRKRALADGRFGDWIKLAFYRWPMGYGEKPLPVIGTSAVVILSGMLLYPLWGLRDTTAGVMINYPLAAEQLPRALGASFYFSTVTFTTLGYGDMHPLGWGRTLATVESFVGALLMALLVFVLGRRATW